MAVFPRQETDVLSPANAMIAGYTENPSLSPHADLAALETATDDFRNGLLVALCFRATVNDPGKLELIGWGKKAPAQPTSPPNQPRTLEAIMQGPGTVYLDWKTPMIGGKDRLVRTYVIYRREQPQGGGGGAMNGNLLANGVLGQTAGQVPAHSKKRYRACSRKRKSFLCEWKIETLGLILSRAIVVGKNSTERISDMKRKEADKSTTKKPNARKSTSSGSKKSDVVWCTSKCPKCQSECTSSKGHTGMHRDAPNHTW